MRNDAVLYPGDAGREGLVVGVNAEFGFLGIQMLLDAVGVCFCPLVGFAVADEVVVGQVGRAVGVAFCLVVCRVVAVGDGHQLVGQAEVQVALVKVAVPVVVRVVPGEVHLAPLVIDFHGVPSVTVSLYAAVGNAGGI